ncbi:MAG: amidohydrolase [Planctomycetes bacterium]|nr:amidohydrolase [Planctomycetota bacterium]
MIDFHAHMGFLGREGRPDRPNLDADGLVALMDRRGIDRAVLLPLESPDWGGGYLLNETCLDARDRYPDRFIVFACADPRYPLAGAMIDHLVGRCGCVGFGEHVNGLPLDDPLNRKLYAKVDELRLPMVFEITRPHICFDEPGLPRLEKMLAEFPNITWVGHGPHFWSAISGEDGSQPRPYPKGTITPGGAIDRLMERFDNLYADLSGMSGYNAMTRDPDFTPGFIERRWQRLLFGTDVCYANEALPIIEWMRTIPMDESIRHAIAEGNAVKLLGLGGGA